MNRTEFGPNKEYCVRFDAYETKVDVVGSLSIADLDTLIAMLQLAKLGRVKVSRCDPGECTAPTGSEGDYANCVHCNNVIDLRG